jgi:[ribosomal protein S18]-alanine N-acetyltransferase
MATVQHDVRIVPGTPDDIDPVMKVMEAAFGTRFGEAWTRSQLSGILPMSGVFLLLACDCESGETLGFSLSRTVADESELLLIAVPPDHHRSGIGRRLLDDFVDRARGEGVARAHLEVRDGNPAIAMYHAAGFSPVGRRRAYYLASDGQRFDAITLALKL